LAHLARQAAGQQGDHGRGGVRISGERARLVFDELGAVDHLRGRLGGRWIGTRTP
jgi:hypothetical protein